MRAPPSATADADSRRNHGYVFRRITCGWRSTPQRPARRRWFCRRRTITHLSQSAFLGYLERLTPLLPLPVYLYNMPSYTKLVIAPETVSAAAHFRTSMG